MRSTGTHFEDLALSCAQRSGLKLLVRNFTCRHGEIDLIMRDGEIVVFVEVRYRRSTRFVSAVDSVGASKRARLVTTASLFLQAHPELARHACRFDVFAISGEAGAPDIEWHRDAFQTQ